MAAFPSAIIFLEALSALLTLFLAIAVMQDMGSWPTGVALLFAAGLVGLLIPFPTHYLNTSEDIGNSKRRIMWYMIAAFVQFVGFALGFAAFIYGLATNLNGLCEAETENCATVRIGLAFDTLLWLFFFAGFLIIIGEAVAHRKARSAARNEK